MGRPRKSAVQQSADAARRLDDFSQLPSVSTLLDDDGDDPLTLPPMQRSSSRSTRATFKGVFIPTMEPPASTIGQPLGKRVAVKTASSSTSPNSYTRENSGNYDTPATSVSVTPADSVASFRKPTAYGYTLRTTKRKYEFLHFPVDDVELKMSPCPSPNEFLALAVQQQREEDADQESKHIGQNHGYFRSNNSDDNIIPLVSDDSDSLEDVPLSKRRRTLPTPQNPRKRVAASTKSSVPKSVLPKRPARAKAQKAIALASLSDSDDDDPLLLQLKHLKKNPILGDVDDDESPLSDFVASDDDNFQAAAGTDHFADESLDEDDDDDDSISAATGTVAPWPRTNLADWRAQHEEEKRLQRQARERAKLERSHPEIKTMWTNLKAVPKIETKQAHQPAGITIQLKAFQLEGLNWMMEQEKTSWKGGLLGDEMGMGKTIQAVSLIMSDYPAKNPTLVVVPPVALMQWSNEIRQYTSGKLKVLIYHGTNPKAKGLRVKDLKAYDVIMISYPGVESIFRKETKGWKRGEDVVVKEDSAIHAIHFHRLILDEAHSIKSRTTGVAKACFALKGTYKWCLSGTPVQNRIGEFFSLLRFLECTPFANYFCKSCPCSTMHWSVTADYRCTHCNHRQLEHVSVFNQEILNPITANDSATLRKEALSKLRLLTDRVMLRRMKRDYTSSMELPPKEIVIHNEFFGEIERDFSSSIMSNTTRTFDTYVSRGVMLNNYANIFGLIMQMRQVSDHPDLLLKKHAAEGQNVLVCNICDDPAEDAIRSKCKHDFCRACVKDYAQSVEGNGGVPDCPRCHIPLSIDFDQPEIEQDEDAVKKTSIINRIKMENWTSSTKIEMLVYDLYKLRSKKQTLKSIVFSQFTSMLQLIEWRLRRAGFNTVMLDGTMTPAQRQKSIEHFMNNTDVEVFLVSLKAGGVALNLTEASRVFIVDPWWNPAAEWQSADRCHRIGQRRPCVITRLCIEDSVESRIVMLQEKKAAMISSTVNGDDVAMEKLTPEDMQFLFRGS